MILEDADWLFRCPERIVKLVGIRQFGLGTDVVEEDPSPTPVCLFACLHWLGLPGMALCPC